MDERRARLKELASRSARLWGLMPLPDRLSGETRIETRNTLYRVRDGICYSVEREDGSGKVDPGAFIGMRVVGWVLRDDPGGSLTLDWQPGAYAVLWRPRSSPDSRSAVALTSPTIAFSRVRRTQPPPLPLSAVATGSLPLAIPRLTRPPTPPAFREPPLPSTTRLHGSVPPPPETPTPRMRAPSIPPPLPVQARAALRPLPPRFPIPPS